MEAHPAQKVGNQWLRDIAKRAPMLTLEQEHELARQIEAGSRTALDHLVRAHLRLVLVMARELADSRSAPEELISEGLVGLLLAAKRFDPERGRFATYASYWIRACIYRYRRENRNVVRAPATRNARMLVSRLPRFSHSYLHQFGKEPDVEAIAHAFELEVTEVRELVDGLFSRNVPYDASEHDLPSDALSPEFLVADFEATVRARERLRWALEQLPEREREIMEQRHLADESPSLIDLGRVYGVSGERVRQIELKARDRLRDLLSADDRQRSRPELQTREASAP